MGAGDFLNLIIVKVLLLLNLISSLAEGVKTAKAASGISYGLANNDWFGSDRASRRLRGLATLPD